MFKLEQLDNFDLDVDQPCWVALVNGTKDFICLRTNSDKILLGSKTQCGLRNALMQLSFSAEFIGERLVFRQIASDCIDSIRGILVDGKLVKLY